MLPQPHKANLATQTKDAFGSIVSTSLEEFDCFIQEETQYRYVNGQVIAIGSGVVLTSTSLKFKIGMPLYFGGATFLIKEVKRLVDENGTFLHYELIYG